MGRENSSCKSVKESCNIRLIVEHSPAELVVRRHFPTRCEHPPQHLMNQFKNKTAVDLFCENFDFLLLPLARMKILTMQSPGRDGRCHRLDTTEPNSWIPSVHTVGSHSTPLPLAFLDDTNLSWNCAAMGSLKMRQNLEKERKRDKKRKETEQGEQEENKYIYIHWYIRVLDKLLDASCVSHTSHYVTEPILPLSDIYEIKSGDHFRTLDCEIVEPWHSCCSMLHYARCTLVSPGMPGMPCVFFCP